MTVTVALPTFWPWPAPWVPTEISATARVGSGGGSTGPPSPVTASRSIETESKPRSPWLRSVSITRTWIEPVGPPMS